MNTQSEPSKEMSIRRLTVKEQLEQKSQDNKEQGEKIKRLQALFEKNPDLQETLDILRTVNIF